MKLKQSWLGFFLAAMIWSVPTQAKDAGLRIINTRDFVRCGTDLSTKTYAFKDKDKQWKGIDADLCRLFALAVFGNSDKFELVNVPATAISAYLANGSIDIMLGNNALSASAEIQNQATAVDVLYYDKQMFLAHPKENATSMEDYKGSNVCVVKNSEDMANVNEYSRRYDLGLKLLTFGSMDLAKQAFFLNRCQLLSSNEIYLRGAADSVVSADMHLEILPEVITYRPVYAYVAKDNPTLRIIAKWLYNAPVLAEAHGITSKNVDVFIGVTETSLRNLLGVDPQLWTAYGLQPEWVKKAVKELGNYGEIYERNLGADSEIKIERDKNKLIENGGLIIAKPFL